MGTLFPTAPGRVVLQKNNYNIYLLAKKATYNIFRFFSSTPDHNFLTLTEKWQQNISIKPVQKYLVIYIVYATICRVAAASLSVWIIFRAHPSSSVRRQKWKYTRNTRIETNTSIWYMNIQFFNYQIQQVATKYYRLQ